MMLGIGDFEGWSSGTIAFDFSQQRSAINTLLYSSVALLYCHNSLLPVKIGSLKIPFRNFVCFDDEQRIHRIDCFMRNSLFA